jgi:hypothetical protein
VDSVAKKNPYLLTLKREGAVASLAGLRTQGHEPFGSALRGDFPVLPSVFMPHSFPNTAARQFRILTGFPATCLQNKQMINV